MAQQDDDDTNTRIGLIIAFGASALVVGSVVAGAVYHQLTRSGGEAPTAVVMAPATPGAAAAPVGVASAPADMSASAAAAAASVSASGATAADVAVVDVPLSGETVGEIFFALGSSALPAKGAAEVERARGALAAAPGKRLVISGFHDASGGAAVNAEIAKQRALAEIGRAHV
jgi:outer membrane protein OmpA-like peptidoglycan-associated protein